ncbi:hypothetical protein DQ04_11781050 [Trypanosoma grayi]|uniref:hypothetical protein n=1 Tax=Trypanosoma grayi TaxID=71804 RepID=UPI0004F42E2B|nr:hypothetical protein DQ04_11781050 [Trypanosoma grayi]KEG06888.1 hypothetical protein DQ04_11781050 [Trypanosoma grayi]
MLSLTLPAVGLEIGAHLTPRIIAPLRGALLRFLLCFVPTVFVGMTLLGRALYALLWWPSTNGGGGSYIIMHKNMADGGQGALGGRGAAEAAVHMPLWGYAALFASIAVERSSVACLATIRSTRSAGVYTVFVLSIAAVQDVAALLLFVLCSAMLKSGGNIREGLLELAGTLIATCAAAASATAVVFLMARSPYFRDANAAAMEARNDAIHSTKDGGANPNAVGPCVASTVMGSGSRFGRTSMTALLLLVPCGVLALWSWLTPSELLLAAVLAGSAIHARDPFAPLEAASLEFSTWYNVVLFAFMGLRVTLTAAVASNSKMNGPPSLPTASLAWMILAAIVLFVGRLLLLLAGAYCGLSAAGELSTYKSIGSSYSSKRGSHDSTVASVSVAADGGVVSPVLHAAVAVAAAAVAGGGAAAVTTGDTHAVSHSKARLLLGFCFVTQLAVALALVQRVVATFGPREASPSSTRATTAAAEAPVAATAFAAAEAVVPMAQAFGGSVLLSLLLGPVLCGWVLRRIGEAGRASE